MRSQNTRIVGLGPEKAVENKRLKEFLFQKLYSHSEVRAERKRIIKSVEGLFKHFMERPRSLPPSYFVKTKEDPPHRVVCDYIAGMTDNYLLDQYRKYLGD